MSAIVRNCLMCRNYFSNQQLQFLLERLLLVLLEPRTFSLYDTICSNLAAVVTIMKNRKVSFALLLNNE